MKFAIDKKNLIKPLENVYKAIDSNNIYAQLRNFFINVLTAVIVPLVRLTNPLRALESAKLFTNSVKEFERAFNRPCKLLADLFASSNAEPIASSELNSDNIFLYVPQFRNRLINWLPLCFYYF